MNTDLTNLEMTPEEEKLLAWCYANLEDRQMVEVEAEALEIAMRQINTPLAAQKLLDLLVNVFILLPGVIAYLVLCAGLAIDHFSEGFLALRPTGFTVQAGVRLASSAAGAAPVWLAPVCSALPWAGFWASGTCARRV